jgi:hypothetical protein
MTRELKFQDLTGDIVITFSADHSFTDEEAKTSLMRFLTNGGNAVVTYIPVPKEKQNVERNS